MGLMGSGAVTVATTSIGSTEGAIVTAGSLAAVTASDIVGLSSGA